MLKNQAGGYFSTDGSVWTSFQDNGHPEISGLEENNFYFFDSLFLGAFSSNGKLSFFVSHDGMNWEKRGDYTIDCKIKDIAWGNNLFVGLLNCTRDSVITSPDLIHWNAYNHGASKRIFDHIAYGNNIFVAFSLFGSIITSSDGINWTWNEERFSNNNLRVNDLIFADSTFIAVCNNGHILKSHNGIDWTDSIVPDAKDLSTITYVNNKFYILTNSYGRIYTSSDGIEWVTKYISGPDNTISLVYGEGIYMTLKTGGELLLSKDNDSTWEKVYGTNGMCTDITYGGEHYILVGQKGLLCTSRDCIQWTERKSGTTGNISQIVWGNKRAIALESSGSFLTSEDLITWTKSICGDSAKIISVLYGDSLFLAADDHCNLFISSDGVTWERTYTPDTLRNAKVYLTQSNQFFVYIDYTKNVLTSTNGRDWVKHTLDQQLSGIQFITYGDSGFIMRQSSMDTLYYSSDGLVWDPIQIRGTLPDKKQYFFNTATYGQGYYISVDHNSGLNLYSKNGKNWAATSGTMCHKVYYGGGKFISLVPSISSAALFWSSQFNPPPLSVSKQKDESLPSSPRLRNNMLTLPGDYKGKRIEYSIYDLSGRILLKRNLIVKENNLRLDMVSHGNGMYIISIKGDTTMRFRYMVKGL